MPVPVCFYNESFFSCTTDYIYIVMMSFYLVGIARNIGVSALDKVGAERTLSEKSGIEIDIEAFCRISCDLDEHGADDFALHFGVAGLSEGTYDIAVSVVYGIIEKGFCGIHAFHIYKTAEIFADDIALVFTHHAVVDMYGIYILGRKRLCEQGGGNSTVDTAGNENHDLFIADSFSYHIDRGLDSVLQSIDFSQSADTAQEIFEHDLTVFGKLNLGMELNADYPALLIVYGGDDIACLSDTFKAVCENLYGITVAHEDSLL